MRRSYLVLVGLLLTLAACGKKSAQEAAPAAPATPAKVSVDSTPAEAPPPPPVAAAPAPAAPAAEAEEGNWFSKKTVGEKREIMEGWLHQYQAAKPADKTEILKQIQNSKLSAADRALLESLRAEFKYPPLPIK